MNKAEFIELLEEIECTSPATRWTMYGFHVWPLIRLQLFAANAQASVLHDAVGGGAIHNAALMAKTCAAWAGAIVRDRQNNSRAAAPADVAFLAYSAGTQPVVDGRRWNPLLGPYVEIARRLGKRAAVWEMCHDGEYNLPRAVPSTFIQGQLIALRIRSLYLHKSPPGPPPALDGYENVMARIAAAGLRNRYSSVSALERDAYFVRRTADWFKRQLVRVSPSHGVVADYGPREQAFCLACRELQIDTIELQHGVVNDVHPAYARWRAVPPGGYETRPRVFWCWDEEAQQAIARWAAVPGSGATAIVGGDPWREQWLRGDAAFVDRFDRDVEEVKRGMAARTHVLVTLDPTGPVIPDLVLEAMRRSPREWFYWVRLHPVGQRARLPLAVRVLADAGVRCAPIDRASQWPLPGLLRHMDVHVTPFWSTVVLEAEDFGVQSVACAERAREVFPRHVREGTLVLASTADELIAAIASQAARRKAPRLDGRPDPVAAMCALLAPSRPASRVTA